ncbi:unnamed protein product, partial [Heterotrigona itama]
RSINEDEENARSESNSGGSSPSDLKKRLQHHPSPNEGVTRMASRVIGISRRLSRKRDFCFHGTSSRIEENVENEETVEEEATPLSKKRLFSDLKAKDARARRRAKIRLANETDRDIVASKSSEGGASDLRDDSANSQRSEKHSEHQRSPLGFEVLTNASQRHSSLSARLYRNQEEETNSGCSSQRNAFHRVGPNTSRENSPNSTVELQPVSPISLRNSSRSTYRRFGGVILQNLSSGSEAESNFEENTGSSRRTPQFAAQGTDISSNLRVNDPSNARNFNDDSSLSSRRSSSQALVDSSRNEYLSNKLQHGSNDPLTFALSLHSPSRTLRDRSFYKILQSSRSDCGQSAKKETLDEEPMFFSARREIRDHNSHGECSQPAFETLGLPSDVAKSLPGNFEEETSGQSCEKIFNQNDQETINRKKYLNCREDRTFPTCGSVYSENYEDCEKIFDRDSSSTPKSMPSPEVIVPSSMFQKAADNNLGFHSPNAHTFEEAISRCILNNETNVPRSSRNIMISRLSNASEDQSAASSFREFFINDFNAFSQYENFYSHRSAGNSQETHSLCSNKVTSDKEFANVPTLVLNSQEASYSTSPNGKDCSGGARFDPNTLIMALSNASLKRRTTAEDVAGNICADSNTVSGLGSSENDFSMGQCRLATSRRSSLSVRSKIPVRIPSDRSKSSIGNKSYESDKRTITPVDSAAQSFQNNSSSLEGFQFDRRSHENSSIEGSYAVREDMAESSATKGSRSVQNESVDFQFACKRGREILTVEKSDMALMGAQLRNCLSSRVETSDDNRSESKGNEENQNCDRSGVDGRTANTLRFSTFVDNSKNSDRTEEQSTLKQNICSGNESDSFSPRRDVRKCLKSLEGELEESTNVTAVPLENYQSTYEREFFPRMVDEQRATLFENRMGDSECRGIMIEDSERSRSSSTESPVDDGLAKPREIAENHDKLRFSIEKLAADQFRRNLNLKQTRTIQSDTVTFFPEKTFCDVEQFTVAGSSSASRLRHDRLRDSPRFKKRSQDRFPFTISEKTSIASTKFKVPGRLANLDEDEEDRGYKLDTHPSITRLAGSEFEDSPADIISYVARTELPDRCAKSSGMKGLVKKFSAKWRKSRRRRDNGSEPTNATSVIYKNQDYREECESSNCSELSSLREFKIYESTEERLCEPEPKPDSPDEKSSIVHDRASYDEESNKNTPLSAENPCRRYDRDDLWVQPFKDLDSDRGRKGQNAEAADKGDEEKSQDPYSVFFVKNARETAEKAPFASADVSTERQKNRVKFRASLVVTPESTENVLSKGQKSAKNRNPERLRRDRNAQSECFCLRFYRMIVSISFGSISKYRSRIDDDSSSVRKRSRVTLQRKNG